MESILSNLEVSKESSRFERFGEALRCGLIHCGGNQVSLCAMVGALIAGQLLFAILPFSLQTKFPFVAAAFVATGLTVCLRLRLHLIRYGAVVVGVALLGAGANYLHHASYAKSETLLRESKPRAKRYQSATLRREITLRGVVEAPVEHRAYGGVRFSFVSKDEAFEGERFFLSTTELPWQSPSEFLPGMELVASVRLRDLRAESLMSYEGYLERRGYLAYGTILRVTAVARDQATQEPRRAFIEQLYQRFGHTETLDVLLGATLGVKDVLGERVLACFQRLGLTHLLVVSGFHIAILFSSSLLVLGFVLGRSEALLLTYSVRRISSLLAFITVAIGMLVVGVEPPVFRSLLVFAVFTTGQLLGRKAGGVRVYLLSAAVIHLIWPCSIVEVGFQLTYLAVLGLYCARVWERRIDQKVSEDEFVELKLALHPELSAEETTLRQRAQRLVARTLLYSAGAWCMTNPIVVSTFSLLAPTAIAVNVLVGALFTWCFIVLGGISLLGVYLLCPGAEVLLHVTLLIGEQILSFVFAFEQMIEAIGLGAIELEGSQRPGFAPASQSPGRMITIGLSWLLAASFALASLAEVGRQHLIREAQRSADV